MPSSSKRNLSNWLKGLADYVENTEAPRHFWLWGGIFTICCALQRRVWLPYGIQTVYPNLYVLIVAPPGGRKGGPVGLARDMLQDLDHHVSADSLSKRRLTRHLGEISGKAHFDYKGKPRAQAPLAIISKEFSSLLTLDPKVMIEILTDLFDSHGRWDYETDGVGMDNIRGVCVSCFAASTPTWIAGNLPPESIGGGFTSRCVLIYGDIKYKEVAIPDELDPKLYTALIQDLNRISRLVGEFTWNDETREYFTDWYSTIPAKVKRIKDARLHTFMSRVHVIVLKVAMALRVAHSEELILTADDIGNAVDIVEATLPDASSALGGHGRSKTSKEVEVILNQIRMSGKLTFTELLRMNHRNTNKTELEEVMETVCGLGYVKELIEADGTKNYIWKGEKK
jgi:hypothetical protein